MATEWKETTLGAEVDLLTGFPFKSSGYTDSEESIRLVRGDNIVQGAMRWVGVKRWPQTDIECFEQFKLRADDVVLAMDRPWIEAGLKYAAISKHDLPCLLVQRTARLRGGQNLDTRFLRYLVGSREFTQHIQTITTGTAVPHISASQIKDYKFPLPSLPEQKAIARILGALDDKIELNRQMNATLEEMAQALFQSWFVDFDPVRAKAAGKKPEGISAELAALFPKRLVNGPEGEIPEGWTTGKVRDLCTFGRESINPAAFPDETFAHFSLPAFDEGKLPKLEPGKAILSNKLVVENNAVLLSKLNPHIPRIWMPSIDASYRAVCSTEFLVACPCPNVSKEYLFSLYTSTAFSRTYGTLVTGTTGSHQRIKAENVLSMGVTIPPDSLLRQFDALAKPLYSKIVLNIDESSTLAELRDTLLPKLLSGEIRVKDAARKVEDMT